MDRIKRDMRVPCSFLEYKFIFSFIFLKRKTFVIACLSEIAAYHIYGQHEKNKTNQYFQINFLVKIKLKKKKT